jgi:chromosome segregation ATPase
MDNSDNIEVNIPGPTGTSPEVQEAVVRIWELIYALTDAKETLKSQKEDIENQYNRALVTSDEYELKIQSYQEELKRSSLQQEDNRSTIEGLKKKNAELNEQLAILEGYDSKYHKLLLDFETLQQKATDYQSLGSKADELQLIIDEQDREIFSLNTKIQAHEKEFLDIKFAHEDNARKNKELHEKSEEILELRETIAGLENELLKMRGKGAIPDEILRELNEKESLLAIADERIILLQDEIVSLEEKYNVLLAEKTEEKSRQLELWSDNENNITILKHEIGNLKMNLREAVSENEKLHLALEELNLAYEQKTNENKSLSDELSNLRISTEESTRTTESYIIEINKLNERITDSDQVIRLLRDKINEQQESISSGQDTILSFTKTVEVQNEKIKDYDSQVSRLLEVIAANEAAIRAKESEIEKLKVQLKENDSSFADLNQYNEQLNELQILKSKLSAFELSEKEYKEERDMLRSEIDILAGKLDSLEDNFAYSSQLEAEIEDLKKLNEKLIDELKNLQSEEKLESELFEENRDLGKILLAKEKELSEAMTNLRLAESKNIKESANVERLNIRIIELEGIIASMKAERDNIDSVKSQLVSKIENQIKVLDEAIRKS